MALSDLDLKQFARLVTISAATFEDQTAKISPSLWERVEPLFGSIVAELGIAAIQPTLTNDIRLLSSDPHNSAVRDHLEDQIYVILLNNLRLRRRLLEILLHLSEFGRLLPHHGLFANQLEEERSVSVQTNLLKGMQISAHPTSPDILVVLPFRCSQGDEARLRNLLSCIASLNAQSLERKAFHIIAVEQDNEPLLQEIISPLVDQYVFAQNSGQFSIAWGRNVGVKEGPNCEFVCLLDTDLTVGPNFLRDCLSGFSKKSGGVLPFHRVLCLDSRSSSFVATTLATSGTIPSANCLRGHVMNEVYGFAIATTKTVFDQIGGQDERYRDWGDEDNEFYTQLRSVTDVRRIPTLVYHLDHKRPEMRRNGRRNNAEAIASPRKLGGSYGSLDMYYDESAS